MNREELYRIWKAEKNERTLHKVPSSFYTELTRLLNETKAAASATTQDRTQKALYEKELKILQRFSTEVAEARMKKILDTVVSRQHIPTETLPNEEAGFAKQIALHVGDHYGFIDDLVKGGIITEKTTPSKAAETRLELVRFLSDFPAIIGVDLKTYGPFKAEDIATLPVENASALISQGVVKQVRYSEGTVS